MLLIPPHICLPDCFPLGRCSQSLLRAQLRPTCMSTTHWFLYHSRLPSSQLSSSYLPVLHYCYISTATTPQLPVILLTSQLSHFRHCMYVSLLPVIMPTSQLFTLAQLHVSMLLSYLLPTCMTTVAILTAVHLTASTSWLPPHIFHLMAASSRLP